VEFGPEGFVKKLDASFVQHREEGAPAARGEFHIENPAPPARLGLGIVLNGKAAFHGTVSCDKPARVTVTQVKGRNLVRGSFSTSVPCTPGTPTGSVPFQRGNVEVEGRATATDPDYSVPVETAETAAVRLTRV